MRNGPPSEWVSVALLAIGADAQVCTEVEASHRLSHDSAESDQPAVLLLLPREAEGIIEQRNLVWCVPTECNSPERTPGLHAATHHSLIHCFFSSFLFDWSALVNLGFLQKAAKAFTAVPDGGVDPLWVTYTEPILCFFFPFWRDCLSFWLRLAPTFQERLSTRGRPSCACCGKWLQIFRFICQWCEQKKNKKIK